MAKIWDWQKYEIFTHVFVPNQLAVPVSCVSRQTPANESVPFLPVILGHAIQMTTETDALLERLYRRGVEQDAVQSDRSKMLFNITPATGQFLALLVSETRPTRILEIGTSNGYSTIWLARAALAFDARIVSLEKLPHKTTLAQGNLESAGFANIVDLVTIDAATYLADCDDRSFGFIFLDSSRAHYVDWWNDIRRILDWGMLVVDNAISHADELREFVDVIQSDPHLDHAVLPIGRGQLVVTTAFNVRSGMA